MLYRRFGKTNEMVSILGFGCMRFPLLPGGDSSKIDEGESMKMVRYAIDNGLNYLDTAYPYHGNGMSEKGSSEPFVAKVIKDGYREKVKIATKLPTWLIETREDMDKYLNEQLERLEIEYIDFYLLHTLNKKVWEKLKFLGVDEFLDSAIEDGRIKYAGFSYHDKAEYFNEIIDYYDFSFCQIQFNYLDEDYQAGLDGLKYAKSKDLGLVIMEPLRGGKLAAGLPQEAMDVFNNEDKEKSPAEWALRWVLNHSEVSIILSGMSTMDQVIENINISKEAKANSLSKSELNAVEKVKDIYKSRIKVNCTTCGYCMPCPQGVDIPRNFTIYNNYYMFDEEKGYENLKEKDASHCIQCKICETHCPQSIEISKELEKVVTTFQR
ncbi:aldo/keto reductase [Senegalia sp. (in: firmicutes)]|uniref:aldo/keto reductase n=2 Tax=Senegalia sp. (in: firmicutes) TaxID=1924098 RepID=UPI003F95F90E